MGAWRLRVRARAPCSQNGFVFRQVLATRLPCCGSVSAAGRGWGPLKKSGDGGASERRAMTKSQPTERGDPAATRCEALDHSCGSAEGARVGKPPLCQFDSCALVCRPERGVGLLPSLNKSEGRSGWVCVGLTSYRVQASKPASVLKKLRETRADGKSQNCTG